MLAAQVPQLMAIDSLSGSVEQKAKILVLDAHAVCREGVEALIGQSPDLQVCAGAAAIEPAIETAKTEHPRLIVADLFIPGHTNIDVLKHLLDALPGVPVLVLSTQDEIVFGERYIKAGARGYVSKLQDASTILAAIRHVLHGHIYVSPALRERIINNVSASNGQLIDLRDSLSNREMEILQLIGQGLDTSGISNQLHVSPKTVAVHKTNLKRKLNVANSSELMRLAVAWEVQPASMSGISGHGHDSP